MFVKRCVDLASTENDTFDFRRFGNGFGVFGVWDYPLEVGITRKVFDRRSSKGMAEKGFGEK